MRAHDERTVVVIGAGLAGLTAAATAARAGQPVVVVDAHAGGGRARTDERSGYRFNQGPHALYRGGEAWQILRDMGVVHRGHLPPLHGARGARGGELVRLETPMSSLVPRLLATVPARWAGRSAEEWAASLGRSHDVADLARTAMRVSTYVADLERMPADVAIAQLKAGLFRGVSYVDGGWARLVGGLWSAATAAGATIRTHQAATGISGVAGAWDVTLAGGESLRATAVVLAVGSPEAARALLPVEPAWPELGPPVTAACLDLGVRTRRPGVVFGLDEPLYLSRHAPPGDLAPEGGSVVHVMRYGARQGRLDRAELRRYTSLAGIGSDHIEEERFLANMVVTHVLPSPARGLAGRPEVAVPGAAGLYLAGDWVGPTGWLADAAMASARQAGTLAVRASAGATTEPRVA